MQNEPIVAFLPPLRLAAVTEVIPPDASLDVQARVRSLFDTVDDALRAASVEAGPPVASYGTTLEGLRTTCGLVCEGDVPAGLEVVELPGGEAVCGVHLGAMESLQASWNALQQAVFDGGYTPAGHPREIYVDVSSEDPEQWVIELQQPVSAT